MRKKLRILPFIIISFVLISAGDFYKNIFYDKTEANNESDYYSMSYEKFVNLEKVNKTIDIKNPDYELINASIFHETNRRRINNKLKTFIYSPELTKAAMFHSKNMVIQKFYDHIDKINAKCKEPSDRIIMFGGNFSFTGENIYRFPLYEIEQYEEYYIDGEDENYQYFKILANGEQGDEIDAYSYIEAGRAAVAAWMLSKGHKDNLLNTEFSYIGCGSYIKEGSKTGEEMPTLYVTQNFGNK